MDMTPEIELMTKIAEAVTVIDDTGKIRLKREKILSALREYGELKQSPRWVKAIERLPEGSTSFGTMSKFVAVRYYDSLYKETMTGSGRYCHDRRKWYVSGWENGEVIEWLDESEPPKNRLSEVVGKWPGDEPLEETLKGVSESPR